MSMMIVLMLRMKLIVSMKIQLCHHRQATLESTRSPKSRVLILPGSLQLSTFHFSIYFEQKFLSLQSISRPYLTISGENRFSLADDTNKDYPITIVDHQKEQHNETGHSTDENDDIQGAASGITVPLSKSLANFQDSKEIMMTSDSESDYKYSSTNNVPTNTAHVSPCPQGELRCINGRCITISQLCDKVCVWMKWTIQWESVAH